MPRSKKQTLPPSVAGDPAVKERRCLMCGKPFVSLGPGERICRACKGSTTWRQG